MPLPFNETIGKAKCQVCGAHEVDVKVNKSQRVYYNCGGCGASVQSRHIKADTHIKKITTLCTVESEEKPLPEEQPVQQPKKPMEAAVSGLINQTKPVAKSGFSLGRL